MRTRGFTYGIVITALAWALVGCPGDGGDATPGPDAAAPDVAPLPTAVTFEDPALEQCVRAELGVPEGEITFALAATITYLECRDLGIVDLSGLEHFGGLTHLSLWENDVRNLTPLAELLFLEELQLGNNDIRDLGALAGLVGLRRLGLGHNLIRDVSPLAGLTALEYLNLDGNQLEDVSALAGLTSLTWLTIEQNGIVDTAALETLEAVGVETYRRSFRPADGLAALSRLRRDAVSAPAQARGRLSLGVDADGEVVMQWATADARHPVVREFTGALRLDGDRVRWQTALGSVEVGAATDAGVALCAGDHAAVCQLSVGKKTSGARLRLGAGQGTPLFTADLTLTRYGQRLLTGAPPFEAQNAPARLEADDVMDFAFASPNQFDAGSCIFMAHSGAMEILMNQHLDPSRMEYLGDTDLSERFLMNAGDHVPGSVVPYFPTDLTYIYNYLGGSLLSRTYPFTAGYVKENANGGIVMADSSDPDAYLSCYSNWFDELPGGWEQSLTPTPEADRTAIFVDPLRSENSIWNVGIVGPDVVERIKYELRTKNAPVIVVYNHYLYWHADVIVGYDDSVDHSQSPCPMVDSSVEYYNDQGAGSYSTKIESHRAALGGCDPQGVFYVRDSIYDGEEDEEMYYYLPNVAEKYSKRIITRTYNWVTFLANHVYSVHRR